MTSAGSAAPLSSRASSLPCGRRNPRAPFYEIFDQHRRDQQDADRTRERGERGEDARQQPALASQRDEAGDAQQHKARLGIRRSDVERGGEYDQVE